MPRIDAPPPVVDLTRDPEGASLLAGIRQVGIIATPGGMPGTEAGILSDFICDYAKDRLHAGGLEIVRGSASVDALLLVDVIEVEGRGRKSASIVATLCQRQSLKDGTLRIAILWRGTGIVAFEPVRDFNYTMYNLFLRWSKDLADASIPRSHRRSDPSVPLQSYDPTQEEKRAASLLNMARSIADSRPDVSKNTLWKLVRELPRTKAAQEAWRLLGGSSIESYTELIRQDPQNAEAYYRRACAHSLAGNRDMAIADCTEAIRLDLRNAGVFNCRGDAYRDNGDMDEAIGDYTEAIRLDPKNAWAYGCRGFVYGQAGQLGEAITDLAEAIRLDPKNAWTYGVRALAQAQKGEWDKSIADYTEAIRLDPQEVRAYRGRGSTFAQKGEWDKAIADYTEAIRLDPKDASAQGGRAEAYMVKGELERAINSFSEAIRLDPKYAAAFWG